MPCERCVISYIEPETNRYIYWHTESDVEVPSRDEPIDEDEWKGEGVYDTKRPLRIGDLSDGRWGEHRRLADAGIRSLVIIPIVQGDKCIAHMVLSSRTVGAFSQANEELLISIASHIGSAIRNATLHQTAQDRAARLAEAQRIAHLGNWEWDILTNERIWSEEVYRIFGLRRKKLTRRMMHF